MSKKKTELLEQTDVIQTLRTYLLRAKREIEFIDIGKLKVKMPPKHLTVFDFFLMHPEGVAYRDLIRHRDELQLIYRKYSDVDIIAGISNEIDFFPNLKRGNRS